MPAHGKPTATHLKEGTFRASRHASARLEVVPPLMPADLPPTAQAAWKVVCDAAVRIGTISEADGMLLRLLAESWEVYRDSCDEIRAKGVVIIEQRDRGGTISKPNPALVVRDRAWKQVFDAIRQLGLTPASRAGIPFGDSEASGDEEQRVADILKLPGVG